MSQSMAEAMPASKESKLFGKPVSFFQYNIFKIVKMAKRLK
jgi:hypothetical protein